jgi:hypothetical protein
VGCEARKIPAVAGVFFLDFPFYRTYQELTSEGSFEIAERAIRGALVGEISRRLNHT